MHEFLFMQRSANFPFVMEAGYLFQVPLNMSRIMTVEDSGKESNLCLVAFLEQFTPN